MPEAVVSATARAGALLALALGLWYGCSAAGLPFLAFAALFFVVAAGVIAGSRSPFLRESSPERQPTTDHRPPTKTPLLPLLVVVTLSLALQALTWRGTTGDAPHWFLSSDEAFTTLAARGLEQSVPPTDLSWSGQPLRYHLGAALVVDLLHRATRLPVHAIQYGLAPVLVRLILVAALLLLARRLAPNVPARWRVWLPLAAGAFPTIDFIAVAWHARDLGLRGTDALATLSSVPMMSLSPGLLGMLVYESSSLALAFAILLIATWRDTTWIEKGALLFAVFLAKSQVFLAVGAGYGAVALLELARRRWQAAAAGALALACVAPALRGGSTYGDTAHITLGYGALCRRLLARHQLAGHLPDGVLLAIEAAALIAGVHVVLLAIGYGLRRLRRAPSPELLLGVAIAGCGLAVTALVTLVPSPELQRRFLAVHAGVAHRLFIPLPDYLPRIFDVSVTAALDAFTFLLPLIALPLLAAWMVERQQGPTRRALLVTVVSLVVFGVIGAGIIDLGVIERAKEVDADAQTVLLAIPADAQAVITNDLAWDDRKERHLPLLNLWAPALSGRQFWASAFMFTFQYPDAAERLQRIEWFFAPSTPSTERLSFARKAGIDFVFLRREQPWSAEGWTLMMRKGRYELYRRAGAR